MKLNGITDALIAERGLDATDRGLVRSVRKRVDMALRYQRTNGMVEEAAGDGDGLVRFRLAT